jgi:thiamine kinase-like enzyme
MILSSTNTTDLVQRDSAIEGMRIVLDPEAFLKVLRPYLNELRIENLQMTYIRYKPHTRCLVNYRLNTGNRTSLNMYAIAHGFDRGGASVKIQNVRNRITVNRYNIPGRIILEDKGIVVSVFPNDSKLKGLRFLDNNENQKVLLNNLFPDRPIFWNGTFQMLNYKPERRFVAMLETKSGSSAVIRFYTDHDYHLSKKTAKVFHSLPHLRLPKKIGFSNHHRVLAFEWLDGEVLSNILVSNYDLAVQALHNTGVALAEFHMQKVDDLLPYRSETEKSNNLVALANYINFILPHLSTRTLEVVNHLVDKFSMKSLTGNRRKMPVHGDLHMKQILIDNHKQASFIDLDESGVDDPRVDLGFFIAHLKYMSVFGKLEEFRLPIFIEAFLRGYQQVMGEEIARDDLDVYVAAGLFHLLPHPFRNCEKGWRARTEQILKLIESDINKSMSNELNAVQKNSVQSSPACNDLLPVLSTNIPVDYNSIGQDPNMPFLLKALNPHEIEPPLLDMINSQLGKNVDARLSRIQVMRYKPNRRCLIEYEIEVKDSSNSNSHDVIITLLGKAHSKGPDFTTYNLVRDLWNSGFDASSTDLVSVPQPIGIIPEFHMWFQRKVQGLPVIDLLTRREKNDDDNSSNCNGLNLAARIAEAVHKIHQRGIKPVVRKHTISDELKILDERLLQVAEENPHRRLKIKNVLDACHDLALYIPSPEKTAVTSIHRDFYHDQVIVDGNRFYLTDFDNYCMGDPALDIGNFKAHLEEYALRKNDHEINNMLSITGEAFVKRLVELSSSSRFSIEAYTVLALARHISISTQFSDRLHTTEALISLCERRLCLLRDRYKKVQIK